MLLVLPVCGESRLDSELTREQKEDLILQAKALGARAVYTAGAGEPTIDKDFLHLARFIHEQGLEWVVYSNGITFSNERQALRNTGLTPRQLAEKVAEYGVTIVYKLWSTDANTNNQLTGTRSSYDYQKQIVRTRNGSKATVDLSTGLLLLQEVGSKLALETLCTARTFDDVYHVIVPLAEQLELPIIVEPILLNGGAKEQESLILSVEQLGMIDPYLTDFGPRNFYSVVIDNRGYMHLSHGTVNLANPNPAWNAVGRLFEVLHSDQIIATHRYERLPELR